MKIVFSTQILRGCLWLNLDIEFTSEFTQLYQARSDEVWNPVKTYNLCGRTSKTQKRPTLKIKYDIN